LFAFSDYRSRFFREWGGNGLSGYLPYRTKAGGANLEARSALGAFFLINDMDPVLAAGYRLDRAFFKTDHAGLALNRINMVRDYFPK